jgi:hypothetical protein
MGRKMKHPSSRALFEHWNERRGGRLAPERSEIEPAAIRKALGDTFMLECGFDWTRFRIAGTRLCALFGRELKGESFIKLWQPTAQTAIRELFVIVVEEKVGVVASASGATRDDMLLPVQLELTLLPLAAPIRGDARVMGALAPMAVPYWLGAKAIGPLTLGVFRHIGPVVDEITPPRLQAADGRIKHGLTVYDGGLAQ